MEALYPDRNYCSSPINWSKDNIDYPENTIKDLIDRELEEKARNLQTKMDYLPLAERPKDAVAPKTTSRVQK